jgi:hypothetical protein
MKYYMCILSLSLILISCGDKSSTSESENNDSQVTPQSKRPLAHENGKFFEKNGRKFMYGGKDSSEHFDISNTILKDEQYHYGIGREGFMALTTPEFINMSEADEIYPDTARFLLLQINGDIRAYGIDLLTKHEVVNDIVDGKPVMAAYCILADLGAIYDRVIDGREYTFALSGYTYFDPEVWDGMDGFVFLG